jgi:hypothetical protein
MAGPSIAVRIIGDLTGFTKSVGDTATKGESAAGRLHSAFTGALGALNATGVLGPFGDALNGIDDAISKVSEHGKAIGPAMLGVGTAVAGIGVGLAALGSKDQAAHQQLQQAVQATGHDYEDYAGSVEKAIGTQEKYGTTAGQTQDALRILTQALGDPQKALDSMGEAANLAAAKHESLSTAATQLGKAYGGNAKTLKEFGIDLKTMTDAHGNAIKGADANAAAVALLGQKISGQADAAANTFGGHLSELKAKFEDMAANLGAKYGPAITAVGTAMAGVGAVFQAAPAILGIMQGAWEALTGAEYASMLPYVLIIAGLALVAGAVYELVTHWSEVWGEIQAIVMGVWQWIVDHWPLLLAVILGPIGIAAAAVITHWDDIKNAAVTAYQWVVDNWPLLLAIITGPIGLAVLELARHWDTIKSDAADVWTKIQDGWNGLVDFFRGIPGQLGGLFTGMWDGIWQAFRSTINKLIDGWNGLSFTTPSLDLGPIHVGGETIGVPHIPHLAQGGLITADGLIYAHAGEAITPLPSSITAGPAVAIQSAYFSTEVDVDLLMRRAAWAVQTRAA